MFFLSLMYKLIANDHTNILFTKQELLLSEYMRFLFPVELDKNIYIKEQEHEQKHEQEHEQEHEQDTLREYNVPGLDGWALQKFKEWATIAVSISDKKQIMLHRPPLINTSSQIMKFGIESTGESFKYLAPIIQDNTEWTSLSTGINYKLLNWIEEIYNKESLIKIFDLIMAADFLDCEALMDLTAGYISFLMIKGREYVFKYYENTQRDNEFIPTCEKIKYFINWRDNNENENILIEDNKLKEWHVFFRIIQKKFLENGRLKQIILHYQSHRGLAVPRETWTEKEWNYLFKNFKNLRA